jgi:hypothetical protein
MAKILGITVENFTARTGRQRFVHFGWKHHADGAHKKVGKGGEGGHIREQFWSLEVSLFTSGPSTCRKQGQNPALSPLAPTHMFW